MLSESVLRLTIQQSTKNLTPNSSREGGKFKVFLLLGYGVHTSTYYPPQSPLIKGGSRISSSLPFIRGGLGWGKTLVNQLFQACVYTVAF
ncbi:hypothetical protein FD724_12015 [Nostoc sp. C057]|nr:hypothetical protein FD724_12015 [Nostoc sp. C057]